LKFKQYTMDKIKNMRMDLEYRREIKEKNGRDG
jgi:hypothetical protein